MPFEVRETSFQSRASQRLGRFAVLILAVLIAATRSAWGAPAHQLPGHATAVPATTRDALCTVEDKFYRDYIVGLGKVVDDILLDFKALYKPQPDKSSPTLSLRTMSPTTAIFISDVRGALEHLWISICEIESYSPWLERASTAAPELQNDLLFLRDLANATVTELRSKLQDFEFCEAFQPPKPLSKSSASSRLTATGTAGTTIPAVDASTRQTINMSEPCDAQLQFLQPHSEQDAEPHHGLVAILESMLTAVARLDAVVKREFS